MDFCDYKHIMQNHGCPINPPVLDLSGGGVNPINPLNWVPYSAFDPYTPGWTPQQTRIAQGDSDYAANYWASAGIYGVAGNLVLSLPYSAGFYQAVSAIPFGQGDGYGLKTYDLRAYHPSPYGCMNSLRVYHFVMRNLVVNVYYSQAESSLGANDGRVIFSFGLPAQWEQPGQTFIDWLAFNYGITWPANYNYPDITAITISNLSIPFSTTLLGGPWALNQVIDVQNIGLQSGFYYNIYGLDNVTSAINTGGFSVS